MTDEAPVLIPGNEPPMVTPYCAFCQLPAERVCFDVVSSIYTVGIHAQCCNKTSSMRLPIEKLMEARATGAKVYVITPKNSQQGLRPLPTSPLSYTRLGKKKAS